MGRKACLLVPSLHLFNTINLLNTEVKTIRTYEENIGCASVKWLLRILFQGRIQSIDSVGTSVTLEKSLHHPVPRYISAAMWGC